MDHTKIIELFIDDEYEEAGIEAISLVSRPAHDETWLAFNSELQQVEQHGCGCDTKHNFDDEEALNPYTIVEDDFCNHNPQLDELGESYSELIKGGWEVVRVEKMTPTMVYTMQQQKFSNPNADSQLDTEEIRVRYKYIGPQDEKNRQFCADMLQKNRVYTIEDIERLSNPEFGSYNIFLWRGSFNCRHAWVRLVYKKQGSIRNNANSTSGLITEDVVLGPDTRNSATRANPSETDWRPGQPRTGQAFMTFAFDEEKKIIIGAAMVPNRMIHRYDALGNLYYVFFSAKSIKMMSDRFLKQRRSDETNIEHDGKKLGADKVFINESWISEDETYDKSAKYGFSLPVGTWYVSMKVLDDKVWKMIKQKSLTGFSVEGLFAEKSVFSKEDKKINQIKSILKSINDE